MEFSKILVKKVDAASGSASQEYEASQHTMGHPSSPSADYDPSTGKYLVAWSMPQGTKGRYLQNCVPTGNEFLIKEKLHTPFISYNSKSNLYGIIGEITVPASNAGGNGEENYYLFVGSSGNTIDGGRIFTDFGPTGNKLPVIAANTQDGTFAAISSKDYGVTRFVSGLDRNLVTTATNNGGNNGNNPAPIAGASVIAAKNLGAGIFPDVAFYQGKLYIAADNKLYLSSYDLSDITLVKDFGYAGFPRLTVYNNALWMAYRGSDDGTSNCGSCSVTVWRSDTGNIEKLPFTAEGNDPVAAGYGYLAFNSQGSFRRRALTGGIVTVIKPNRPTGINRILQDGSIVSVDQTWYSEQEMQATGEHSYAVDWGTKPYVADDLTVVEDSFIGGNTGRFNNDASSQFTVFSGEESFTPHAAADGNGNYVIATWGKPGVRMAVIRKTSGNPTVTPTNPTSNPTNTPLNLPPPNHPILFGYYYADGRYGDYTAEVNSYTNLYIADSSIYDTATDWKPSFRQSLQRASSNNKNILLMVNNENTRNEVLDIAKPFWDNVKLIEVGHEPNWDRLTAESKINELKSQLSAKGLPLKPIGITFVSLSDAVNAQGMDWAGVEAYINPPGDSNTQTNVNQLNSLITQAKSTIPSNKNIVLIMMAYDRNGQWTNMQTLKGLQQPVYMQAYNDPRVIAIAMFSYARTGGARDHAELKEVQQAIGQKILNG